MEILYPMVISAVAVLATLIYASYLDIRDRRVPFIHWLPMLVTGVICTGYLLWQETANLSLIFGYLSLVASFLYADYLDNRGRTDSLGLTFYYRKTSIFFYLALVLILPILSWFVFAPSVNIQIVPWYAMFAGIFSYISYKEYRGMFNENTRQSNGKRSEYLGVYQPLVFCTDYHDFFNYFSDHAFQSRGVGISVFRNSSPVGLLRGFLYFCDECTFLEVQMHGHLFSFHFVFLRSRSHHSLVCRHLDFCHFSVLINALLLNLVAPIGIFIINCHPKKPCTADVHVLWISR